ENTFEGDPQWMGALEKPNTAPPSATNRFVDRYAYYGLATNYQTSPDSEVYARMQQLFSKSGAPGEGKETRLAANAVGGPATPQVASGGFGGGGGGAGGGISMPAQASEQAVSPRFYRLREGAGAGGGGGALPASPSEPVAGAPVASPVDPTTG